MLWLRMLNFYNFFIGFLLAIEKIRMLHITPMWDWFKLNVILYASLCNCISKKNSFHQFHMKESTGQWITIMFVTCEPLEQRATALHFANYTNTYSEFWLRDYTICQKKKIVYVNMYYLLVMFVCPWIIFCNCSRLIEKIIVIVIWHRKMFRKESIPFKQTIRKKRKKAGTITCEFCIVTVVCELETSVFVYLFSPRPLNANTVDARDLYSHGILFFSVFFSFVIQTFFCRIDVIRAEE